MTRKSTFVSKEVETSNHTSPASLDSFCHAQSSLKVKIVFLAKSERPYSIWSQQIIILYEYLQLISQSFLIYSTIQNTAEVEEKSLVSVTTSFLKLADPSSFLSFHHQDPFTSALLTGLICLTLLKYLLTAFTTYLAYRNSTMLTFFINWWRYILQIQTRIICFFTTSFYVRAILNIKYGDFNIYGIDGQAATAALCIFVIADYAFSLLLEIQFNEVLPTKDYLSAKSCFTQCITLVQKGISQILQLCLLSSSTVNILLFSIINLLLSVIRIHYYYSRLPLYNFQALLYHGVILSLVISLNISYLVTAISTAANYGNANLTFVVVVWLGLFMLIGKISYELLNKIMNRLVITETKGSPELLLHKITIIKQLLKREELPGRRTSKYNHAYLLSQIFKGNFLTVLGLNAEYMSKKHYDINIDINEDQDLNRLFREYLEHLHSRFPTHTLITLHLAQIYTKKFKHFAQAIRLIRSLPQTTRSQASLSASLLLHHTEHTIQADLRQRQHNHNLNIFKYIQSKLYTDGLKKQMLHQVDLQIKVCTNMLGETANVGQIYNDAQLIYDTRAQLQKQLAVVMKMLPEYYVGPYMLDARYHLVLNYSIKQYNRYKQLYTQRLLKYDKEFESSELCEENLYQSTNAFVILSGLAEKGRIVHCSKSIEDICGRVQKSLYGSQVSYLFPALLRPFYDEFFQNIVKKDDKTYLNNTFQAFLWHKNGYLVETKIYLTIHPYIQSAYIDMMIRPVVSDKEYILLTDDGNVIGTTQRIMNLLNLNSLINCSSSSNIRLLSKDLYFANEAFNTVYRNPLKKTDVSTYSSGLIDKPRINIDYNKAVILCSIYQKKGKQIKIKPMRYPNSATRGEILERKHLYQCRMSLSPHGSMLNKLIELEELDEANLNRNQDHKILEQASENIENCDEDMPYLYCQSSIRDTMNPRTTYIETMSYRTTNPLVTSKNTYVETPTHCVNSPLITSPLSSPSERQRFFRDSQNQVLSTPALNTEDTPNVHTLDGDNRRDNPQNSSVIAQLSNMQENRVERTLQRAIVMKSHPSSIHTLAFVFYAVFVSTLLCQIVLKMTSDTTMNNLVVKKNLKNNAQIRALNAISVQFSCRGLYQELVGIIKPQDYPQLKFGVHASAQSQMSNYVPYLIASNKAMIEDSYILEAEVAKVFFAQSVQINGSPVDSESDEVKWVTTFQAVDQYVDVVEALYALPDVHSTAAFHLANFVANNVLDDFIISNNNITTALSASVTTARRHLEEITTLCVILPPALLLLVALVLSFIIIGQYRTEKAYLAAFIKLHPAHIKRLLLSFEHFRKTLQADEADTVDRLQNRMFAKYSHENDTQMTSYHKKQTEQQVEYTLIRQRHYSYAIKAAFYTAVLMAIMIWNYTSAYLAIRVIYRIEDQLQYTNYLGIRITINYMAYSELTITNNTTPIEHQSPLETIERGLVELKTIRDEITEIFEEQDGTYDPQVKAMLFDKIDCSIFSSNSYDYVYCMVLTKNQKQTNIITALAAYENSLYQGLQIYQHSNKSSIIALLKETYMNSLDLYPNFGVLRANCKVLGKILDAKLTAQITNVQHQRVIILLVFVVTIVLVGLLIWHRIFCRLREVNNDFKKVLQVLPSNLIQSSFLLKSFLRKTSSIFKDLED